jgi:hypothetical protein
VQAGGYDPTAFLLPEADNEGRRTSPATYAAIEDALLAEFGGLSWQDGVTGVWLYEGHTYRDRSRQYLVALEHWKQLPAWLNIVEEARQRTSQLAIYIEVAGVPDIWDGP